MLVGDIDAYIEVLKASLDRKYDKLREVTPQGVRWAANRVIDGPMDHEKPAIKSAQEEADDYKKAVDIATLLSKHLPRSTVPRAA
jgi:hypothetical protein